MGWKDGMKSESKVKELFSDVTDPLLLERIYLLYKKGFEDGWEASKNYDPKWDA